MAYAETARKKSRTHVGLLPAVALGRVTLTMPNIAAHTTNSDTFKIPGTRVGDRVFVQKVSGAAGLFVQSAIVSDIATVTLKVANATAAQVNGAEAAFDYVVFRG